MTCIDVILSTSLLHIHPISPIPQPEQPHKSHRGYISHTSTSSPPAPSPNPSSGCLCIQIEVDIGRRRRTTNYKRPIHPTYASADATISTGSTSLPSPTRRPAASHQLYCLCSSVCKRASECAEKEQKTETHHWRGPPSTPYATIDYRTNPIRPPSPRRFGISASCKGGERDESVYVGKGWGKWERGNAERGKPYSEGEQTKEKETWTPNTKRERKCECECECE